MNRKHISDIQLHLDEKIHGATMHRRIGSANVFRFLPEFPQQALRPSPLRSPPRIRIVPDELPRPLRIAHLKDRRDPGHRHHRPATRGPANRTLAPVSLLNANLPGHGNRENCPHPSEKRKTLTDPCPLIRPGLSRRENAGLRRLRQEWARSDEILSCIAMRMEGADRGVQAT